MGEDCAIIEFRPSTAGPVLDRAPVISKNDAEAAELREPQKTSQLWGIRGADREFAFALERETLNRLAGFYAQTGKKQPKWFNMFEPAIC
jgi:hypothetical protein